MNQFIRHQDILPLDKCKIPVTVIGAGAIGSCVVLQLAKMGFSDITVYDNDDVSEENMSCQYYPTRAIGRPKVYALEKIIKEYAGCNIVACNELWSGQLPDGGIVVTAVDNMKTRVEVFEQCQNFQGVKMMFDPRMSVESAELHCLNPHDDMDVEQYKHTLFTDEEGVQERCTAKSTIYTANMISGLVVKAIKDYVMGQAYPRHAYWDIKLDHFMAARGE